MAEEEQKQGGYGKRPIWQWVALYAVVAVIIYGAIYYFFLAKKGGYNYETDQYKPQESTAQAPASESTSSGVLMTKTSSAKGDYLTDSAGMALYTFDKDTKGVTNCYDACETTWPPYLESSTPQVSMPANVTTVTRKDGSMQYAYDGWPLYYYDKDTKAGDITGDDVGGVWHLAKP